MKKAYLLLADGTLFERLHLLNAESLETLLVDGVQRRNMRLELSPATRRMNAHHGKIGTRFCIIVIGISRTIPLKIVG